MSLINIKYSGWGSSKENISYTSIWNDGLATPGTIYFLGNYSEEGCRVENLVDIYYGTTKQSIYVCTYPHNTLEVVNKATASSMEAKYRELLDDAISKNHGKKSFTVDVEKERIVVAGDFSMISEKNVEEHTYLAFIHFLSDTNYGGSYPIRVIEVKKSEDFKHIFPVQVWSSRFMAESSGKQTVEGKGVAFILINSTLNNKLSTVVPSIKNITFPSSHSTDMIPIMYKTNRLEQLYKKAGADKVTVKTNSVVDESPDIDFSGGNKNVLSDKILEGLVNKLAVSFSDLVSYGISETLALVSGNAFPITVEMDLSGYARKMCILNNTIYAIPAASGKEFLEEELEGHVIICDDLSYPTDIKN